MESQKRYTKKQRTLDIIERLKKEYPDTVCTLDTSHAWQLLVSVRLAAQCTDARVNVVVQDLFAKYPGVKELAAADVSDIVSGLSTVWDWLTGSKTRKKLRWNCGNLYLQRRAMTSVTGLWITGEPCAQPGQNRIAMHVV